MEHAHATVVEAEGDAGEAEVVGAGWVDDALWATGGSSLVGLVGQPLETACG